MRKILSILLTLTLCLSLVPLTAVPVFATDYDLWVGDVQVTSDNASDILGDGTASYNESKNTLTLNNCAVNGEGHKDESTTNKNGVLFSAMDDLTVELVGQNALIGFNDTSGEVYHGIKAKALTIKGDGDLVATGGAANDAYSYGIYADTLTIDSSYVGTLVATGGDGSLDTNSSSAGILVDGSLEIGGGTVIATGGTTGKSYGIKINGTAYSAISGSRMYVTGGILIAQGGNGGSTANSVSYGIYDAKTDNDEGLSFDGSCEGIVIARGGFVNGSTSGTRLATNLAPFLTNMTSYSNGAGTVYVPNENCDWTTETDISKVLDDLQTGNVLCINTNSTPVQLNATEINTYGNTAFFVNFYEGGEYDDALTGLTLSAENVSISGGGKLVAIGGISTWLYQGSAPYGRSCGLQAKNMTVTSAEVIGVGGPSNYSSNGLGNESNDLCIAADGSAKVTGISGSIQAASNPNQDSTIGILCSWAGTMELSGTAKILGVGGSNKTGSSTGIGIGTTLSMSSDTSVLGVGGHATKSSWGISVGDTTDISGTLSGLGGQGATDSQGVYKRSNTFTVNDGAKVTALGGESAKSCGFYGATANEYCKLDIKGGDFRAAGRTYAINASDDEPSLVVGSDVVLKGYTDYAGTQGESDVISGTYMQNLGSSGIKCIKSGVVGYDLYVGSVQVDETNASDVLGDGKVSYDPASNTLTLNNAIITGGSENTSYYGWGICYRGSDDFQIVANGSNIVQDANQRTFASYGIIIGEPSPVTYSTDAVNVTITVADGASLVAAGGKVSSHGEDYEGIWGIYNKGSGSLTVNGGGTLIANASNDDSNSNIRKTIGLVAQDITIDGSCTVNAVAGNSNMSVGILCGDFTLPESFTGTVNAASGKAPGTSNDYATYGIRATGDVSINGGTVTASTETRTGSNTSGDYAVGIFGENSLSIVSSTVNAKGDGVGLWCYQGTTSINKADVTAIGNNIAANGLNLINVTAEASTETGGSNLVEYDDNAYQTFKYVHTKPVAEYSVTVSASEGGTATADLTSGPQGTEVALTSTPAEGYQFKEWQVVSGGVTIESNKFQIGTEDVEIKAIFEVKPNKVAAPVLPKSTTFTDNMTIEITCETEGAEIYYTTGSAITLYTAPFVITETTTIEAHATKNGFDDSNVVTATYTKEEPAPAPSGGGGTTTYPVKPSSTENGKITVSPKDAAEGMTVTVTVTPDEGFALDKLTVKDKDGNEIEVTEKDGKYTFTMPAAAVDISATFRPDGNSTPDDGFPFNDVPEDAYFRKPVEWAVEKGITSGVSEDKYGPELSCTRAQVVTFLWITCGSEDAGTETGFDDVDVDAYYDKAVAWAVEKGITAGTSENEFSPEMTITRAQFVTMLWVAQGKPEADGDMPFTDVPEDAYYAKAVAWAYANDITAGKSADSFAPEDPCTRGQIMTFLYNAYGE